MNSVGKKWKKDSYIFLFKLTWLFPESPFPFPSDPSDFLLLSHYFPLSSYYFYEGWNFNSGNYLFTTDTK